MTANGELNTVLMALAERIDEFEQSYLASSKMSPSAKVTPSLQFSIRGMPPLDQIRQLREKLNLLFSTLPTSTQSGANSDALRAQNEALTRRLEQQQATHVLETEAIRRQMAQESAAEAERREREHTDALARAEVVRAAQASVITVAEQAAAEARRRDEEQTTALAAARLVQEAQATQIEEARQAAEAAAEEAAAAQEALTQQLTAQQARTQEAETASQNALERATAAEREKTTKAASNNAQFLQQLGEFRQASEAQLAELQRELTAAQREREETRQQLEAQRLEHEEARAQATSDAAAVRETHEAQLRAQLEAIKDNRTASEEAVAAQEAAIEKLRGDIATLKENVATSEAGEEQASARALAAEGRLDAAEAAATASQERQATSEITITRLQRELAAATAQLATVAENHAREMANATTGRNSNKTAALKALEDTNAAHRQQVAALQARATDIQQSLDAERAATEAARQAAQGVQDELAQANERHAQQLTVIEQSGRGRMEAVRAAQAKDADIARLQEELKGAQTACKPGYDAEETRRLLVKEMLELWETKLKPQNLATGAPASEFPQLPKETIAPKVRAFANRLRVLSPLTARRHEGSEPAVVHSLADETRTGLLLSLKELFEIYDATLKTFYRRDEGAAAAAVGGSGAPVSRLAGGRLDQGGSSRSPFAAGTSFRRNRKSRRSTRKTRR